METIEVLISAEELRAKVLELAEIVSKHYAGKTIYAISVLKGGVIFMIDLLKELETPYEMSFMDVSSYGSGTESRGKIDVNLDMDADLTGKNVLIIEDIVDSGNTVDFLVKRAKERNAADVKVCSLLHKPDRTVVDVNIDFLGFSIPDEFVVGYGLDYNQKHRDLKYIGKVIFN